MTFYRFTHSRISLGIFCLILLTVMFILKPWIPAELMPYMRILEMIFTFLFIFNHYSDKIRMDEAGITCFAWKKQLWAFSWEEIDRVRAHPVNRFRGYWIVLKGEMTQQYPFERTRRIEETLKKYGCLISKN